MDILQKIKQTKVKKYLVVPNGTTIIRKRDGMPSERGQHSKPAKGHPWRRVPPNANSIKSGFITRT